MFNRLSSALTYSSSIRHSTVLCNSLRLHSTAPANKADSKKSAVKGKTPMGKLDDVPHPDSEKQPLKRWPDNTNPYTGEVNGPSGPEPTRYGDWERKGKCVDF